MPSVNGKRQMIAPSELDVPLMQHKVSDHNPASPPPVAQYPELRARIARLLQTAGYSVELAECQKRALSRWLNKAADDFFRYRGLLDVAHFANTFDTTERSILHGKHTRTMPVDFSRKISCQIGGQL
jgi:hypothetical protein